jgi:protein-S-isoprenylcysteine O-methyltransferase Ste14
MNNSADTLSMVAAAAVIACWWVFALLFLFRKKHPKTTRQKRNRTSWLGMALVGAGYALVWSIHRPLFTPLLNFGPLVDWTVAVATILLGTGSVWLVLSAVRALGRHWSLAAQLVDDHRLVTDGAYAIVRHPIYTGMLGLLIATGLAISVPVWILVAGLVAWYGTYLRIRSEEVLLKKAFGQRYEEYARKVPALIPWINWSR